MRELSRKLFIPLILIMFLIGMVDASIATAPSENVQTQPQLLSATTPQSFEQIIVKQAESSVLVSGYSLASDGISSPKYEQLLLDELNRYDFAKFQSIGLQKIVLVDSIYRGNQRILGVARPAVGDIYLSTEEARTGDPLVISTIHHELAHFIIDNSIEQQASIQEWPYALASEDQQNHNGQVEGFVSEYATRKWEEDIADTIGFYQVESYRISINKRIETDRVLGEKVILAQELIADYIR